MVVNQKEYDLIAGVIRRTVNNERIAHDMADALEAEYSNFHRDKFLERCGV